MVHLLWKLIKSSQVPQLKKKVNSFFDELVTTDVELVKVSLAALVQKQKPVPGEIRRVLENQIKSLDASDLSTLRAAVLHLIDKI